MFSVERTSGWTLSLSVPAHVARVGGREGLQAALALARESGWSVVVRGTGFSFGDQILNPGQAVVDLTAMNRILAWDPVTGTLRVEPGVTIAQALAVSVPDGWILPVVAGSRRPTLGGALANDVHGKNAWTHGTLADWVEEFSLLGPDGHVRRCSRTEHADLFGAVPGGLGLLGVVVDLTLRCLPLSSTTFEVRRTALPSLDAVVDELSRCRAAGLSHVAWLDCWATGRSLGRGTVESGHPVNGSTTPGTPSERHLRALAARAQGRRFWRAVRPLVSDTAIRVLNGAKYHWEARRNGHGVARVAWTDFMFPLETISDWRHVFAPHGYIELMVLVPFEAVGRTFRRLIALTQADGLASHLTALKSHRANDRPLSFALDGCSMGIDIRLGPRRVERVQRLFHRLCEEVAGVGGRVHLAKDQWLRPELLRRMFPGAEEFEALRRRVDPGRVFDSGMARRLFGADATRGRRA